VDRIERACGKRLTLSALFAGPTVEQLAQALDSSEQEGSPRGCLPVQAEGSRRPFFFLHGQWTKSAFYCFALARACGPDQPFYVLEPCTFSARHEVPTLAAIAAAHIEDMRTVQPHGPYRLGGFCNGGLLAYEMARQLESQGEQIEFLGLIAPAPPVQSSRLRVVCDAVQRARGAGRARRADLYLRARHAQRHVYRRLRPGGRRVQDFGKLLVIEPRLERMWPPREALYADYVGAFTWAAVQYTTGVYRGKITFCWSRDEPAVTRSWQSVIGRKPEADIEEHALAGTHMETITEHIDDLAAVLSACLTRAEHEAGRGHAAASPAATR